jgi:23S rRNA (cytidine1920-2'-O)/16S rRNA (cytidine1409-2'-O)-methyltransferase
MREHKIRLDQLMVSKGLAESRSKAKAMIMAGLVQVQGQRVDKPGQPVPPSAEIVIKEKYPPYVSRGGLKLEAAIKAFGISVKGMTILDVGASTGGFTDCLLQYGASRVIAVDVGYGQLDWRLRNDERVVLLERTNIRHLRKQDLPCAPDGATADVSFISLRLVFPKLNELLAPNAFIIALVKPQFEVGREHVGKGGVVRDPSLREHVVNQLKTFSEELGWTYRGHIPSPLLGPKGNQEYLLYLSRKGKPIPQD